MPPVLILLWLTNSNYGVYLFFVLSGFLIGRMMIAPTRLTYGTFIARRFARIYPAFLLSLLAGALVTIFITKLVGFSWTVLAQNLLFLNGWFAIGEVPSYNFVTWSLFFEFVFYLTIPAVWLLPSRPAWQILGSSAHHVGHGDRPAAWADLSLFFRRLGGRQHKRSTAADDR